MTLYRFSVKHLSRGSHNAPISKHVAYIMREETYGPAHAHVAYITRESPTVRSREDLVHTEAHNLPAWAGGQVAAFFAAAEQYERANGRFSTTWEIALPRELSRAHQLTAVRDFLHTQFGERHVYAWAMHESRSSDGATNPHVHVIFSTRTLDGIDRDAAQFFKRYNATHPEHGGAQKDRFFVEPRALVAQRQAWADVCNWHLERAGVDVRMDPRSLQDQGLDRAPEQRLAPYHSTQAKYQGTLTPEWRETLRGRETRQGDKAQEAVRAVQHWEQRKVVLGLTQVSEVQWVQDQVGAAEQRIADAAYAGDPVRHLHREKVALQQRLHALQAQPGRTPVGTPSNLSREEFLTRVAAETRGTRPPQERLTLDQLRGQEQALEATVARQEQGLHRLHGEVMQAQHRERTRQAPSPAAAARIAALHEGLDVVDEDVPARGARVRLRDRDRGRDAGYSW
jgi:hypothetical protein